MVRLVRIRLGLYWMVVISRGGLFIVKLFLMAFIIGGQCRMGSCRGISFRRPGIMSLSDILLTVRGSMESWYQLLASSMKALSRLTSSMAWGCSPPRTEFTMASSRTGSRTEMGSSRGTTARYTKGTLRRIAGMARDYSNRAKAVSKASGETTRSKVTVTLSSATKAWVDSGERTTTKNPTNTSDIKFYAQFNNIYNLS